MAKGILEFDLNDPDDAMAHLRCVKSTDMALSLWDIIYEVRKETKRELEGNEASTDAEFELHEKIFNKIFETLDERDINIDNLIN
jgi:hypothetical protein